MDQETKWDAVERALGELETEYNVRILARGGAYGSSNLVIRDNDTKEEKMVK